MVRSGPASLGAERDGWDRGSEALYSAWIEHLFDAPPDVALSFDTLQEVLADPERNLLHDHLGLGEDDARSALGAPPDCADLPYVLRAYFGVEVGLPSATGHAAEARRRARRAAAPLRTVAPGATGDARGWFAPVVATQVMDTVHSGSARTALADDATDFYPVALTRAALRPGTVYADPYGHTLMIVQWVPQTAERGGMLLAVDAQPDNSVARKRFWEGTFLFADDVPGAGPGFKAFRPLVAPRPAADVAPLANAALARRSALRAVLARAGDAHARRVLRAHGPAHQSGRASRPLQAYGETLDALVEQLETRVDSVQTAARTTCAPTRATRCHAGRRRHLRDHRPVGGLRDAVTRPPSADRHAACSSICPTRSCAIPSSTSSTAARRRARVPPSSSEHARAVEERAITYVAQRRQPVAPHGRRAAWRAKPALEMAYDPNDCVEVRWGAAPGTDEHATCRRHAPAEQRARMERYREWFREGRRPAR